MIWGYRCPTGSFWWISMESFPIHCIEYHLTHAQGTTAFAKQTPVLVELVSTGASKKAHVVAAVPTLEATACLLGLEFDSPEKNFWGIEHPPADWERLVGIVFHEKTVVATLDFLGHCGLCGRTILGVSCGVSWFLIRCLKRRISRARQRRRPIPCWDMLPIAEYL